MNENLNDFTELHDAMVKTLRESLPMADTVAWFDPIEHLKHDSFCINTPAVLIDLSEITPAPAQTGNEMTLVCHFAVHCILSAKTPLLQLAVRNFAALVARTCNRQHWGLSGRGVQAIKYDTLDIYPGTFSGTGKTGIGYDSMIVEFEQVIAIGNGLANPSWPKGNIEFQVQDGAIGEDVWG